MKFGLGFSDLGHIGVLGGAASPNSFSPLKAKLVAGSNGVIFVNGDSTAYEANGPYYLLATSIGALYDCTVNLYLWDEWNVSAPTGTKTYRAASVLRSGAGPTLSMYLAACPGQVSGYLWDGTRKAAALDSIPTPDVAILHHGHNMVAFDVQAAGLYVTGIGLLHATMGMTSIQWPNVPQIIATQNPNRDGTAMDNIYLAMGLAASAHPKMTKVDTYADFIAQSKASNLYRALNPPGIHPSDAAGAGNHDGGTLQANKLLAAFNAAKKDSTYTTPGWPQIAGSNILTNGDFSAWTGAFPTRVSDQGSAVTAAKDTTTKYGASSYSMALNPNGSSGSFAKYSLSGAERAAISGQTVSAALLFYQPSTQAQRAYFQFQLSSGRSYPQGDLINVKDGWYMAVWSNVVVTSVDANAGFKMYPSFGATPGTTDALRVQKIMLVLGSLPNGVFP